MVKANINHRKLAGKPNMGINPPINRKLKMGLIGGGQGSFIGRVHSIAACLDNRAELVAGALSSDPERAKSSAPDYDIPQDRAYTSYQDLLAEESKRPSAERVDFVSIATPNHMHFEIALAAVNAGFHVMCDKPLTLDLEQAEVLAKAVEDSNVVFGVTHNYTGYPLVRQAREMIQHGELGEIQATRVLYPRLASHSPGVIRSKTGGMAYRSEAKRCCWMFR
ncbi:MAG: Gfo/Idh/MocA family oxidoreductase [Pirellulaceae bacterium]